MIPKVIHYCWFGGNPKSDIMENCIASWKEHCPDYEIIEWNESNFDVHFCPYASEAYERKQWGFLSDIARIKVVHDYGGIYLDVDVLLKQSIDELLVHDAWIAQDDVRYIATGLGFGAIKGHWLISEVLSARTAMGYTDACCPTVDTPLIEKALPQWIKASHSQTIEGIYIIGYNDYPKFAKHLYTASWKDEDTRQKRDTAIRSNTKLTKAQLCIWKFKCFLRSPKFNNYFEKKRGKLPEKIYTFVVYDLIDNGPIYFSKRLVKRIKKVIFK